MSYLDAAAVADMLEQPRRASGGWMARCPSHEDRSPSLSIKDGKTATLVSCHAGCTTNDICAALGIHVSQLFHDYSSNGRGTTSIDLKFRELLAQQRNKDKPKAHKTLGDVMWWTLKPDIVEERWFAAYDEHRLFMDMDFHDAMKMHGIIRDTVVWTVLEPWIPYRTNWHEFGGGFMDLLTKKERELRNYANGR